MYYVEAHGTLGTGSNHFIFAIHVNGTATDLVASHDDAPHVSGLLTLSAGDSVDWRVKVDSGTHTLQVDYGRVFFIQGQRAKSMMEIYTISDDAQAEWHWVKPYIERAIGRNVDGLRCRADIEVSPAA